MSNKKTTLVRLEFKTIWRKLRMIEKIVEKLQKRGVKAFFIFKRVDRIYYLQGLVIENKTFNLRPITLEKLNNIIDYITRKFGKDILKDC